MKKEKGKKKRKQKSYAPFFPLFFGLTPKVTISLPTEESSASSGEVLKHAEVTKLYHSSLSFSNILETYFKIYTYVLCKYYNLLYLRTFWSILMENCLKLGVKDFDGSNNIFLLFQANLRIKRQTNHFAAGALSFRKISFPIP